MEINEVKDILDDYSIISGQMATFDKSAAYFSKGAFQFRCRKVSSMLELWMKVKKYIGNPILYKRNKKLFFNSLIAKIIPL